MKQINFTAIPVQDIEGNAHEQNVAKVIGNLIFNMADDVAEHDLGIKIYHSEGAIDIDENEEKILRKYLLSLKYNLKTSITNLLA